MTQASTLTEANLTSATTGDPVTQGWYLALSADEKVLEKANIFASIIYFSTFTSEASDACAPAEK